MTEPSETPAQGAARRRRWLTFGEIIAVVAVAISAASLWDSHQGRTLGERPAPAAAAARVAPLVRAATADTDGRTLRFAPANRDQVIQTQTIMFPAALGAPRVDSVGNPHIEADWFADKLHAAARGSSNRRLPIAIVTTYLDDGVPRTDSAIYDIGFRWRSRFMRSDAPSLEGVTLVSRGAKALQQRLDTRWTRAHPASPPGG